MIQAATFPPPLFGVVFGLAVSRICKKKINKRLLLLQQALSTLLSQCVLQSFIDFNSLQMTTSFYFTKVFSFDLAPKLLANTILPKRK